MPRCPNAAVAARKDRSWVRPVVWERPEAMWEPIISGGSSWAVQRSICCRSRGSMQSEAQTRSQRVITSRSMRPPPEAQDSISRSPLYDEAMVRSGSNPDAREEG